jgi:predicted amino acid dehydrogenase
VSFGTGQKSHFPEGITVSVSTSYFGSDSLFEWQDSSGESGDIDVVLMTHPRDESDATRLFPSVDKLDTPERAEIQRHLKPVFGEIIDAGSFTVGIMFLPFYAHELIDPRGRNRCLRVLREDAVRLAEEVGARIVCLGGLTGALSLYGRRLLDPAKRAEITVTTGHALTTVGVHETYHRALAELGRRPGDQRVVVLGVGSIGSSVTRLLQEDARRPREIVLVDRPQMAGKLRKLAQEFHERTGVPATVEATDTFGKLAEDSACFTSDVVISAVSTPYVVDIDKVAPGTVLIDDSQPYCWDRPRAWQRCTEAHDVIPCDAGLVDCSSIGYESRFDFDFAEVDADGVSTTAWTCQTEGMLLALEPRLPTTIGHPSIEVIKSYQDAFRRHGLSIPSLQCGPNPLPVEKLRESTGPVPLAN